MSDQPVRYNPVGNMDKDSDPRYIREGNYSDAKNVIKLTAKGATGGAITPTEGNEFSFSLGDVYTQNKKYRIMEGNSRTYGYESVVIGNKINPIVSISITLDQSPFGINVGDYINISNAVPNGLNGFWQIVSIFGNTIEIEVPSTLLYGIGTNIGGAIISTGNYEIQILTMNQDHVIDTIYTNGSVQDIYNALTSSTYAAQFSIFQGNGYVDIFLNTYDYYDYYIISTGRDYLDIFATQEAIPVNVAGPLKANGSYDMLGDLFITSTTIENEPEKLPLTFLNVSIGSQTLITFNSNHDIQVGEWVGISGSNATWLNGTFVVWATPNPNQIIVITNSSWGVVHTAPVGGFGDESIFRNPRSIGEIGVAVYDHNADQWDYTRLLRSMKLNFLTSKANDIAGRDDIRRATLYYTDDYNNRRSFYYYGEYMTDGAINHINPLNFYRYDSIDSQQEISSAPLPVKAELAQQTLGGSLKAGNKRYFCYLVDTFGNKSAFSSLSNIVSAYQDVPSGRIYGNAPETNTGKKNRVRISDIDQSVYKYIALCVIDYVGEVVTAYSLNEITVTGSSMIIDHIGTEETFAIDLAEVAISTLNISKKALNVDMIDNRLVFSNLREEPKVDLRPWAKTFKHRIKQEWLTESSKYQMGEYQDVKVIHDKLGYMMNETYRFGVQVHWKKSGQWSEAAWIDDIRIDPNAINTSNPEGDNRRIINGTPDELSNYDLNESIIPDPLVYFTPINDIGPTIIPTVEYTQGLWVKQERYGRVKVPYVEFSGFNLDFEIAGTPIRNLIDSIKIVRVECIPEVIASGPVVMSVGFGSPSESSQPMKPSDYPLSDQTVDTVSARNITIGVDAVMKSTVDNPLFPISYGYYDGDIYFPIAPKICITEGDSDPVFNWWQFEGTFHEYPFAYGSPSQGGIRPYHVKESSANNHVGLTTFYKYGFILKDADYGLDFPSSDAEVSNAFKRIFYSESVAVGNAGSNFYWAMPDSCGYPDREFITYGNLSGELHWITPLYHYGEDNWYGKSLAPSDTNILWDGRHGMPFGVRVRIANNDASNRHGGTNTDVDGDNEHTENTTPFYPFWINRRILTFYAPDLLFSSTAVPSASKLIVFGEYRMDRRHHDDIACGIFSTTGTLSGYSEYTVENMGSTYSEYDINGIFDIGEGGVSDIYPGAKFRKGYSAHAKDWTGSTAEQVMKDNTYQKYNNLWVNPASIVLQVDGEESSSYREGFSGMKSENKNTDYGVHYVQMYEQKPGKYGSTDDSVYIDTGCQIKISDITLISGSVDIDQLNVFGGDTFTQSTYLATRKINPTLAPEAGWGADIGSNGPGWGAGMKFYSQNRINSQLRTDDEDSLLYPRDTQTHSDWLEDYDFGYGENFRYNESYTPKNGVLSYNSINDRLLQQQTDLPSRIDYSQQYEQNTIDDKNQIFLPLNFKDIDQSFGEILSHKNVNGELFTLQPRKFQAQFFNASGTLQTESTEGLNVVIGDGAVLARDGRSLSAYGTQHKWSVIKGRSPGGKDVLYWFNQESKLIMRFGADGTVVLSDIKGLRSFLENDTRWTEGKDTPYANLGVRAVWDDEFKEAIWTWRGIRKYKEWKLSNRNTGTLSMYNVGDIVINTNAPYTNYEFEQIPDVYVCLQAHSSATPNEPGVGTAWEEYWYRPSKDDPEYYSCFTLAFNEMTNGFSSFYSHMPKIYMPWKNKFLSAHPTKENLIYQHRRGEYTTWYKTSDGELSEDAYIEGIINYLPESSKKFVATQVISDEEPYRMEFRTKRHFSYLEQGDFDDHDDHWRSPIKNDATSSNDPDADTTALFGDYMYVKFIIEKKVYNRLYNFVVKVRERLRVYRK